MNPLPKAPSSTAYVDITLIETGTIDIPLWALHQDGPQDKITIPVYCFLIEHGSLGKKVMFDLGVPKDLNIFPPAVLEMLRTFTPTTMPAQSIEEILLEKRGIKGSQIDQVIFSHVHWDHCHPFSSFFPKATALFGPGAIEAAKPGYPSNPTSQYLPELVDRSHPFAKNVEELPPAEDKKWQSFGTFDKAWDLWGDGSLWILNGPGHVPGNIAAVGRLKNGEWVLMGGDCCHSRQLFDGSQEIAVWKSDDGKELSFHQDRPAARDTIKRLRGLAQMEGVHIALAHVRNDHLMSLLPTI